MSAMMGGQAGAQEDMFAKLESMRAVITEVNNQFKDPVSISPPFPHTLEISELPPLIVITGNNPLT